jgi:mono/diheme cytochrome c family protein
MTARSRVASGLGVLLLTVAFGSSLQGRPGERRTAANPAAIAGAEQLARGRHLVLTHECSGCHGGNSNPAAEGWLAGQTSPEQTFMMGACALDTTAKPCFRTHPRNLTPDNATGIGRFTERQLFNALRYGLRPGETPDVEITSTTPGEGNFPAVPKYLAPPMPWPGFRYMPDDDLRAIVAYLKHGVKPVRNRVEDSEGPPDFWASVYTVERIGPYPPAPFPTVRETLPK